jgi:hypothetical protein
MLWPVINPLSRYRHAKRALAGANPPEWPKSIIARQDAYWRNEDNMTEGNPMLALERGEKVATPPAVWFQPRGDELHDYKDVEAMSPSASWQTIARPAARSRWTISMPSGTPAMRRTYRKRATCSRASCGSSNGTYNDRLLAEQAVL